MSDAPLRKPYPKNRKSRVIAGPAPRGWKRTSRVEKTCRQCGEKYDGLTFYCSRKCLLLANTEQGDGCWTWKGYKRPGGYGEAYFGKNPNRVRVLAHRAMFEAFNGPITDPSMCVCHRCDNPRCVRPDHLFLGTHADNNADRNAKGRQARGERNGPAKLTEAQVRTIRADTRPHSEVAKEYSVGATTVHSLRAGKTWRHVR
jgi:hypothetical protein